MAAYTSIDVTCHGPVTRLTFNRPARRNALTHAMMLELEHAFGAVRDNPDCRVLVLRGAGGHFCAGGDLDAMADMPPAPADGDDDPLVPAYRQFGNALLALNSLPQATVSVVEGSAVGGGFGMACCSDIVLLHASARFGVPEPKVGFIPSQIIPFLVRRMGEGVVRDLAVTGRVIDAAEAWRLGVGRHPCTTEAEIEATLDTVIADVLRLEPRALSAVKDLVLGCASMDDRAVLDDAAERLVGLLRRPQALIGIKAFMAKAAPPWAKG